ncbi:MFS transporter [Vreelandella zhaodongensis]|uniref:MFS transporter n=1 Tax=Vreelandella zhaodongensis TaxID=1176240 RepID=A0ABX2STP3_VREZH|nr:MFS transporter [Halomonas zhaodongensis]
MYLVYLFYFAAEGILYPFWPIWLKSIGYSHGEIGVLLGAAYWPQIFVGLSLAYLADWRFCQLRLASIAALLSTLCIALFYLPHNSYLYLALAALYGGMWNSVLPLSETYLLAKERKKEIDYGRVRAVGSLSFIVLSICGGGLLTLFGQNIVPSLVATCMALTALSCSFLSKTHPNKIVTPEAEIRKHHPPDWRKLRHHPALLLCFCSAGLIQLSHCLYFVTASNYWLQLGYSSTWVGIFWAVAVIAEIIYFALSGGVLRKVSPLTVIMLSGLFAALRWALALFESSLVLILFGQLLHALSFGAYHSAVMRYIRDYAPSSLHTLTQGLYYSVAVALPMGLMIPIVGWLFDNIAIHAYYLMVAFALSGALTAYLATRLKGEKHG